MTDEELVTRPIKEINKSFKSTGELAKDLPAILDTPLHWPSLRAAHIRPNQDEKEEEDFEESRLRQDDEEEERGGEQTVGESEGRPEGLSDEISSVSHDILMIRTT